MPKTPIRKNIVIFFAILLGYLSIFGLSYRWYKHYKSAEFNQVETDFTPQQELGPLYTKQSIIQLLTFDGNEKIAGITFQITSILGQEGYLLTQIVDENTNELLHSSEIPLETFANQKSYSFMFDEVTSHRKLRVSFYLIGEEGTSITISKSKSEDKNKLYVDDNMVAGTLAHSLLYPFAPATLGSYALFYFAITLPFFLFAIFKWNPWTSIWQQRSKVGWIDILLLGIILVFCYFSFNQADLVSTMDHGKDLIIAVVNGDFFKFYEYAQADQYSIVEARYLLPTYVLFGLWNLPVYFLFNILGLPFETTSIWYGESLWILWWNKLLPVLFFVGIVVVIYRIGLELKLSKEKAKWMAFFWASFPIVIYSQFIFGQYDSFCLFFTLIGFLYYLRKDLVKFTIFFAIAMTFKTIPLFLFIPLLLYAEKRVIHIFKYVAIVLVGVVLFNVMFLNDPYYVYATEFSNRWTYYLFYSGIAFILGKVSLFPLLITALSLFTYSRHEDHSEQFGRNSVYIALAAYSLFFSFSFWHPQWVIHLTVFLVMAAFMFDRFQFSMFVDIGFSILFFGTFILYWAPLDSFLISRGVLPRILHWDSYGSIKHLFTVFGKLPEDIYITLFIAILMINLVIKYPKNQEPQLALDQPVEYLDKQIGCEDEANNVERDVVWFRLLSVMVFIFPVLVMYLFSN